MRKECVLIVDEISIKGSAEDFQARLIEVLKEQPVKFWVDNLGVSRSVVSYKWMGGISVPEAPIVLKILEAMGYSANWLFFNLGAKKLSEANSDSAESKDASAARLFFRLFPKEVQDFIQHAVKLVPEPGTAESTTFLVSAMNILIGHMQKQRREILEKTTAIKEKQIFVTSDKLVMSFEPNWALTYANNSAVTKFQINIEGAYGKPFRFSIHPEDSARFESGVKGLSVAKPVFEFRGRVALPDSSFEWQEWLFKALYGDDDKLLQLEGTGAAVPANRVRDSKR